MALGEVRDRRNIEIDTNNAAEQQFAKPIGLRSDQLMLAQIPSL